MVDLDVARYEGKFRCISKSWLVESIGIWRLARAIYHEFFRSVRCVTILLSTSSFLTSTAGFLISAKRRIVMPSNLRLTRAVQRFALIRRTRVQVYRRLFLLVIILALSVLSPLLTRIVLPPYSSSWPFLAPICYSWLLLAACGPFNLSMNMVRSLRNAFTN